MTRDHNVPLANTAPVRTLAALGFGLAVLLPPAQAERGAYTYLSVQHTAVERQGDTFIRHAWDVVELNDPIKSELVGYQTFIDGKLTMDHQARAEAWVVSGIELGDPGQGPRLKGETEDSLQFNGTPVQSATGAVWERSESLQRAQAYVTTDLGLVAESPQPHTLMFYWLLDGLVAIGRRAWSRRQDHDTCVDFGTLARGVMPGPALALPPAGPAAPHR